MFAEHNNVFLICPKCEHIMGLGNRVVLDNKESHICIFCGHYEEQLLDQDMSPVISQLAREDGLQL
jgi:hypothetical protein